MDDLSKNPGNWTSEKVQSRFIAEDSKPAFYNPSDYLGLSSEFTLGAREDNRALNREDLKYMKMFDNDSISMDNAGKGNVSFADSQEDRPRGQTVDSTEKEPHKKGSLHEFLGANETRHRIRTEGGDFWTGMEGMGGPIVHGDKPSDIFRRIDEEASEGDSVGP